MKKTYRLIFAIIVTLIVFSGCSGRAMYEQFDGEKAFTLLKKQVEFGPRVPGTESHAQTAEFLTAELAKYADKAWQDRFTKRVGGKNLEMRNIYGIFNKDAKDFVLLCAHWDTRPIADKELDREKQIKPIPGANDGASGVAVLLEMARLFKERRPDVGVFIALFDGEDYGLSVKDMMLGSSHFASNLKTSARFEGRSLDFRYGILLDLVGEKDLVIPKEGFSVQAAPDLVDKVWKTAKDLGYEKTFVDEQDMAISDDHVPLIKAGIKTIDIIDFDYGPWHTLDDTVDKCSPKSLEIVGKTVTKVVYSEPAKR